MMRLFFFLVLMFLTAPIMAQDNGLKPLPDIQSLNLQTFVSQSDKIEKTFDDDVFIAFEVQLPKNFIEQDFETLKAKTEDKRLYGELFRKKGPTVDDVHPYFTVKSFAMARAISTKNWLVTKILHDGHTLRSLDMNDNADGFEAMYVRFGTLGNTEIVRAKGYHKGPRMVVAEYVLPVSLWSEQADYQTYAIKSFELNGEDDSKSVETMKSYSYLNSFSMAYPQSWILDKNVKNDENRIDLSFKSADDLRVVFANVNVTVVSTKSLRDAMDRSVYPTHIPKIINARKDEIIANNLIIGDLMERQSYNLAIDSELQITEIYPLRKKLTNYVTHREASVSKEFWMTVIKGTEDSGKSYILSMVVPSRASNLDNWALAVEAYKLMIESIR